MSAAASRLAIAILRVLVLCDFSSNGLRTNGCRKDSATNSRGSISDKLLQLKLLLMLLSGFQYPARRLSIGFFVACWRLDRDRCDAATASATVKPVCPNPFAKLCDFEIVRLGALTSLLAAANELISPPANVFGGRATRLPLFNCMFSRSSSWTRWVSCAAASCHSNVDRRAAVVLVAAAVAETGRGGRVVPWLAAAAPATGCGGACDCVNSDFPFMYRVGDTSFRISIVLRGGDAGVIVVIGVGASVCENARPARTGMRFGEARCFIDAFAAAPATEGGGGVVIVALAAACAASSLMNKLAALSGFFCLRRLLRGMCEKEKPDPSASQSKSER